MTEQQDNSKATHTAENLTGLHCPECGYALTGLSQYLCPECGQTFDPIVLRKHAELGKGVDTAAMVILTVAIIVFTFCLVVHLLVRNEGWVRANFPAIIAELRDWVHLSLLLGVFGGIFTGCFALCTFITAMMRPREQAMAQSIFAILLLAISAWLALSVANYLE